MARPRVVAIAAPSRPRAGTGPQPKIRIGSSAMLIRLASQSDRIATAASPAPRKMALIRNNHITVRLPPSMMAANSRPCDANSGVAPRSCSRSVAHTTPAKLISTDSTRPVRRACTAATAASSGEPSPIRRATIAVAPMQSPMATEKTSASSESERPRIATASGPSRATKKTSTTAKSDCIAISSTIGMAAKMTARPIAPLV